MVFEFPWWCKYCRRLVFCPCARTVVHQKHPTGLCEHCGEEESVEHVICVCQKYTNEREIMKNELRKMGVDELKLKNIVTGGLESLFLYLMRTELFYGMGKLWSTLQYSRWR